MTTQPARLGPVLARIDQRRGRLEIQRDLLPHVLASLALETQRAAAVASIRLAGLPIDPRRAVEVVSRPTADGLSPVEAQFLGCYETFGEIARGAFAGPVTPVLVARLHAALFRHLPPAADNADLGDHLLQTLRSTSGELFDLAAAAERYEDGVVRETAHPIILIAVFVREFLALRPFPSGTGRVSRLLASLLLSRHGYTAWRYSSLAQRILDTNAGYVAALRTSEPAAGPLEPCVWPWVDYFVDVVAWTYLDCERRAGTLQTVSGRSKQDQVRAFVLGRAERAFRISDVRMAVPHVSDGTIRIALESLRRDGRVQLLAAGRDATWVRILDGPSEGS